jgi:outer membrane protein TolC
MRCCIYLLLFGFPIVNVYAQQIDHNNPILYKDTTGGIGEKLVQLAWNNHPSNQMAIRDAEIARVSLTQAKWSWLDQIRATGNINEFTINPNPDNNLFYPRYNFSVSIPLGIFVFVPTNTNIAKKEIEKADLEIQQQKLTLRNQVLNAYQNYLMYEQILSLKRDLTEVEYANFLAIEDKFETGEVTLQEYKIASKEYSAELENQIITKNQLDNAKLELEMLIGINLEEAFRIIK